jgi:hypothetical protein
LPEEQQYKLDGEEYGVAERGDSMKSSRGQKIRFALQQQTQFDNMGPCIQEMKHNYPQPT